MSCQNWSGLKLVRPDQFWHDSYPLLLPTPLEALRTFERLLSSIWTGIYFLSSLETVWTRKMKLLTFPE